MGRAEQHRLTAQVDAAFAMRQNLPHHEISLVVLVVAVHERRLGASDAAGNEPQPAFVLKAPKPGRKLELLRQQPFATPSRYLPER